ncbi:hypothetical protein [Pseudomonas orientalis]|uniref:hypothetical protein n=1 Tax=Pseudomonas orientalis TaxID=76758 RepID=UPI000F561E09|nr:hypothetical protein [Pseudomonas orientalis]
METAEGLRLFFVPVEPALALTRLVGGQRVTNVFTRREKCLLGISPLQFGSYLSQQGVGGLPYNAGEMRFMPHINITRTDIHKAAEIIKAAVREHTPAREAI